jgi:photosystem II stability/assembly factor-like uncharacterized protein
MMAHQPHDPMSVVAVSPNYSQDQTVFVGTDALTVPLPVAEYVPLVSTNGGFTFTVMRGLPNQMMLSGAVSPGYVRDGTVFLGGQGGLWRSTDRGGSWTAVGGALLAADVQAVAMAPNFATKGVIFAITAGGVFGSKDRGNTWMRMGTPGPLASDLTAIAVSPNYAADRTLLAGSAADGIFKSTDWGNTWAPVTAALTLPAITAISFSPSFGADRTIFAATRGSGFLVSTDGGANWAAANTGITDLNATAIALSPHFAQDSTLWIATAAGGVFRSADRAASWSPCGTVGRPLSEQTATHFRTLAAAAGQNGPVLFLGMFEGLWISTDSGATWQYGDAFPTRVARAMYVSPGYPQDRTVFVSTYGGGTLWSTDGGQNWAFKNTGLVNPYTDAVTMSPNYAADKMAFVGTTAGLQRISAGSSRWQLMEALGIPTFPRSLGISPGFAQDSTIFIGTHLGINYAKYVDYHGKLIPNQGLFISVDAGNTWAPTGIGGPPIDSIAVSPAFPADRTVFAGSSYAGLFKSTDGGTTFAPLPIVAGDTCVLPVAVSPAYDADQTVFAATSHSGIYKSTDGGGTWRPIPGSVLSTAFAIALSPNYAADRTLFLGTMQQGLLKSVDGGNTLLATTLPDNFVTAVNFSPGYAQDHTVFAAGYGGIYKSTDGGSTWVYMAEPARLEEDRTFTISYQGSWPISKAQAASTAQLAVTTQTGASATLKFMGSGARWIGMKGPQAGTASILLDGILDSTVVLTAPQNQMQQSLWLKRGLACGVHAVTIVASPESGQSVTLDALDTWQDTCPH